MNALLEVWPLWWIGSLCACGVGLLLAKAHRAPVHRVAWMRWSLLSLFVWALAALVPADRLVDHESEELSATSETGFTREEPIETLPAGGRLAPPRSSDALLQDLLDATNELAELRTFGGEDLAQPDHGTEVPYHPLPQSTTPIGLGSFTTDPRSSSPSAETPTRTTLLQEGRNPTPPADRLMAEEGARGSTESTSPRNWRSTLLWAWFGGTLVVLTWLALGRIRLHRILRRSRAVDRREVQSWLEPSCRTTRTPRVLVSPDEVTPFCTGLLRPTIVLPRELVGHDSEATRRAVLEHELSHLAHRDPWTTLLMNTALIVFWPQPLVWLLRRSLRREVERRADERAALRIGVRDYAARLIELREHLFARPTPAALSMARHPSEFFRRMETLMKRPLPQSTNTSIRARLLRSALATTCCVAAIASFGRDLQAQDRARVSRIEQRINRVETRLDELAAMLRSISSTLQQMQSPAAPTGQGPGRRLPGLRSVSSEDAPAAEYPLSTTATADVPTLQSLPVVSDFFQSQNADMTTAPAAVDPTQATDANVPVLRDLPLLSALFDNQTEESVAAAGSVSSSPFGQQGRQGDPVSIAIQYLEADGRVRALQSRLATLTSLVDSGNASSMELHQVTEQLTTSRNVHALLGEVLKTQIRLSESRLAAAQEEHERSRALFDGGYTTQSQLDQSLMQIDQVRAELEQLRSALDQSSNSGSRGGQAIGVVTRLLKDRNDANPRVVVALEDGATLSPGDYWIAGSNGSIYAHVLAVQPAESPFGKLAVCTIDPSSGRTPRQGDRLIRRPASDPQRPAATGTGGGQASTQGQGLGDPLPTGIGGGTGGSQAPSRTEAQDPRAIRIGDGSGGAVPARSGGGRRGR
ncbi:MAG: M56 family metallopeptidase [Planctomycetota bacterium]